MRVLHWLNTYLPDLGGIQTLCADLIPELTGLGHEIILVAGHSGHAMPDHTVQGGIEVHRADTLYALLEKRPGDILRAKARISRVIADFDPDVIHLHPCGPDLAYYLPIRAKQPVPMVLTLHNNYSQHGADYGPGSMFGRAFALAERIAPVSADARDWMLSLHPAMAAKTTVIHNGIRLPERPAAPLPWDPPVIVYVGRLEAQKRLDRMLHAFATVAATHQTVRLRIVGAGTHMSTARTLAEELAIADRVEFVGAVGQEAVPALLQSATIFLLTSDFEGLPMAVLEAAGLGRPVVSTRAGGVPEAVIHEQTGLLTDDEPADVAHSILRLLSDRALAERLGSSARAHIESSFSMAACARGYDAIYAEAVDEMTRSTGAAAAG